MSHGSRQPVTARMAATLAGCAALMVWATPHAVRADVFDLDSGGQLRGELLNPEEKPRRTFSVRTSSGGVVTLDRSRVVSVTRQSDAEKEYERRRIVTPDTVAGHLQMATFCRQHRLNEHRSHHLQRIIELEPAHTEARRLLGYRQVHGRWMTRDELMASRGMIFYEGQYRSAQEIALRRRAEQSKDIGADWKNRLRRWRQWLDGRRGDRVAEAVDNFKGIDDVAAAQPLAQLLESESNDQVKLLLIEVLAKIPSAVAVDALVRLSLYDDNESLRVEALDHLVRAGRAGIEGRYIKALRDKDNIIVNRAATALRTIQNPSALSPLIDSLVTVHQYKVSSGDAGQMTATMSPQGGTGFSFGSSGPRIVKEQRKNPAVLSTLIALSGGENFEYDEGAWRRWLATQKRFGVLDARRDP